MFSFYNCDYEYTIKNFTFKATIASSVGTKGNEGIEYTSTGPRSAASQTNNPLIHDSIARKKLGP